MAKFLRYHQRPVDGALEACGFMVDEHLTTDAIPVPQPLQAGLQAGALTGERDEQGRMLREVRDCTAIQNDGGCLNGRDFKAR
jgi:hypothetical protein